MSDKPNTPLHGSVTHSPDYRTPIENLRLGMQTDAAAELRTMRAEYDAAVGELLAALGNTFATASERWSAADRVRELRRKLGLT